MWPNAAQCSNRGQVLPNPAKQGKMWPNREIERERMGQNRAKYRQMGSDGAKWESLEIILTGKRKRSISTNLDK